MTRPGSGPLLLLALLGMLIAPGCGQRKPKAVILVSVDTLRQDHLGCYGYKRDTSPHLDRLAQEEGVLFESAYIQAPYTLPSHMSILTGLYPETHGILIPVAEDGSNKTTRLSESVTTLAESFQARGYKTAAFTDGGFVHKKYGFDQGFDLYMDDHNPVPEENGFRKHRQRLVEWITRNKDQDFFLFIHTFDTHSPLVPPEPFRSKFLDTPPGRDLPGGSLEYAGLIGLHHSFDLLQYENLEEVVDAYDGCVAFVDDELGKLFGLLRELGLWEESLLAITSDHGELFMENGLMIGHGLLCYNEVTLVPLLLKLPGSAHAGRRVTEVVESVDLMPTLLSARGLAAPREVQGQDLLDALEGKSLKKRYAYGISPNIGYSRYLVMDGVKFMEAVDDPKAERMAVHMKPMSPPGFPKPGRPYWYDEQGEYFYNFQKDPLGLIELFRRGDAAYDLSESRFEWKARPIEKDDLVAKYKKAACEISDRAAEAGKAFQVQADSSHGLTAEEMDHLKALGYGGMLDSASQGRRDALIRGRDCSKLDQVPPLIDRALLDEGDELLWRVQRYLEEKGPPPGAKLEREIEKARSCYERFLEMHPEKRFWVLWRLGALEDIPELLDQKRASGKPKK